GGGLAADGVQANRGGGGSRSVRTPHHTAEFGVGDDDGQRTVIWNLDRRLEHDVTFAGRAAAQPELAPWQAGELEVALRVRLRDKARLVRRRIAQPYRGGDRPAAMEDRADKPVPSHHHDVRLLDRCAWNKVVELEHVVANR